MRHVALLVAAFAVTLGVPLAGEAPEGQDAQAPPVFGVGVDVVAVDVSVVNEESWPVVGLGPEDFRIEVDGTPRRLVSVEYLGRDLVPPPPPPAHPTHFSSNEDEERGRLVLFLVDEGNIARGHGRQVFASAARFISNLPPADLVGLAAFPGGPTIEFTSERDEIQNAMRNLVGQAQADRNAFRVPMTEAVNYVVNHNELPWDNFVKLECSMEVSTRRAEHCRHELEAQAHQVVANYRERSFQSRHALLAVLRFLRGVEGSKTVVLISEGLWTETLSEVKEIADAVADAQVTLHVLLLEKPAGEAQFRWGHRATPEEQYFDTTALYNLAGQSRGAVLRVIGSADAAFARLGRELTGHYLLGFEPGPGDRDGRRHSVKVEVTRPKVAVRARTHLSIPVAAPSQEDLLLGALRSPRLDRSLAVRVASFAMRAPDPGKVRLLIAAQVASPSRPLSVGYSVSVPGGQVVANPVYHDVPGGDGEWAEFLGEVVVEPGRYLVRLAAVDATGRRGSVEHVAKAALVSAGGLEISDLVLWAETAGSTIRPAVDLELEGEGIQALVELGGGDASRLAGATVAFELADFADGPALVRVPAPVSEPEADGRRVARVGMVGGLLPPGEYTGRAEVSVNGKPVAVVARPFRIVLPPPGSALSRAPLASVLVETRPFDSAELLGARPLLHFVERVSALVPQEAPKQVKAAIEEARQGRPEAMLDRLGEGAASDARADFLRGVSHYARGDWEASLVALRSALGRNSELFPAAVYMGACYAANGHDLEAIGAWQTALIGETGSPTLYAVLGDALLRVNDSDQAVAILAEGAAAFPDDELLRRRLALAHAVAGDRDEALPVLTTLVDEHPDDDEVLLATLALLFEGFSRTTAGAAASGETEQLVRYARAYVEGEGPNREVVERWLRYLESYPRG